MNATTPKDVVVAFLNTQGQQAQSTGGFGAKPETIRFVKERSISKHQLHFITFEDERGEQCYFTCEVDEVSDGTWRVRGGFGGGRRPQHASSRVYLGGSGDSNPPFQAGGYVGHNGHTVACVHLLSANNVLLEDTVDDDIVLFLNDRFIEFPI